MRVHAGLPFLSPLAPGPLTLFLGLTKQKATAATAMSLLTRLLAWGQPVGDQRPCPLWAPVSLDLECSTPGKLPARTVQSPSADGFTLHPQAAPGCPGLPGSFGKSRAPRPCHATGSSHSLPPKPPRAATPSPSLAGCRAGGAHPVASPSGDVSARGGRPGRGAAEPGGRAAGRSPQAAPRQRHGRRAARQGRHPGPAPAAPQVPLRAGQRGVGGRGRATAAPCAGLRGMVRRGHAGGSLRSAGPAGVARARAVPWYPGEGDGLAGQVRDRARAASRPGTGLARPRSGGGQQGPQPGTQPRGACLPGVAATSAQGPRGHPAPSEGSTATGSSRNQKRSDLELY